MTDVTRRTMLKLVGASAAAIAVTASLGVPAHAEIQSGPFIIPFAPLGHQPPGCPPDSLHQPFGWILSAEINTGTYIG